MFENCSQVILKVTKDCNLRCTYCYVKDKDHYKGQNMSFDLFKKLIQRIILDQSRSLSPPANIQIVFHGGEPTLLGKSEFQRFINYAKQKLASVSFGLQTNTTNLDDEWLALLIKNNISPGISIDGISSRENELRKQGYSFTKALKLFRKYNLGPGILSIVSVKNHKSFPKTLKNIMQHTTRKKNTNIRANYVEDLSTPNRSNYELTGEQLYDSVYKPLLEKAIKTVTPPMEFNLRTIINKFTESFLTESSPAQSNSNCYTKFCRGGNTIVEVEPTGEINSCGRWDTIRDISTVGHIEKLDPWGILSLRTALNLQLLKIQDMRYKKCDTCSASAICDYGCIAFSYIKYNGKVQIRKEISCELFSKLQNLLFANRYRLLIISAQIKHLNIEKTKQYYAISLPTNFILKKNFKDENIKFTNNKLYIYKKNIQGYQNV